MNSNDLAIKALKRGDFRAARDYFELEFKQAKKNKERDKEYKACMNLGSAYGSLGQFQKAIDFFQRALGIAEETGNKDSDGTAYLNLGSAYGYLGQSRKAIEFSQRALGIAEETGNKDLEGTASLNLGGAYHSLGQYQKGIQFSQRALGIAEETGNKDLEGTASLNLGGAYHSLGQYQKGIQFSQRALGIAEETGNKDLEGTASLNLGGAYHSLGQYQKGIQFSQRALGIAEETGNKDSEGKAYLNLGKAHGVLGQYQKAIEFGQLALGIASKTGSKDLKGEAYGTLGFAHCSLGQLQQGIKFCERALSIAKDTGRKRLEASTNRHLARCHLDLGNVEKAFEFLKQSLKIAKDTGEKGKEGLAYVCLGEAYAFLRDFKKAFEFLQYALSIGKETGAKNVEQLAYTNLGMVFLQFPDDLPRAEEYFKSSIKLLEEVRDLLQDNDKWKISFRDRFSVYTNLWCLQLLRGKTMEAFFTAERGRAQALTDLMKSRYSVELTQLSSEEQMERISCIPTHIPSPMIFIAEVPEKSVNFWLLLKGQQWQFVRKKTNQSLVCLIKKAYKQLKVGDLVRCEDRSLDGIEDEEIEESSDRGTNEEESTPPREGDDALKKLYDIIIAPCLHLINGDELVIVPDGASFLIPYAALVDQNCRYLSETLRIRLAPSVTSLVLLAECPEDRHGTSGVLLVGDPWVETVRLGRKRFGQLPWAEKEVKMLEKMLNVQPLTGKNATKERVLSRLESVSLVHIAAHGRSETGEILLSPNHASPERLKEQDFLLTMEDVLKAKLRAKLVVLSCCHTGKGKICAEGVVGIARAFLGAGARSVIASLWAIEDKATMEFMRNFYEHLIAGHSASKSLNQAMKLMRESGEFNEVRQWAPFVLIGDDVTFDFSLLANEGKILTPS